MILHSDRYFNHDYDVKHDLLSVKWLSIESLYLPEILHSVRVLADTIRNYDIRNLLIDASQIHEPSSVSEDHQVIEALFSGLASSHLEKLARIESGDKNREAALKNNIPEINRTSIFEVEFFKDLAHAHNWLGIAYTETNLEEETDPVGFSLVN